MNSVHNNSKGLISLLSGVKSRIDSVMGRNRLVNDSVYLPNPSDSILCRFCLASLILLIVGGFSTSVWGYDWYARVGVSSGKGTAYIEIYNNAITKKKVTQTSETTSGSIEFCKESVTLSTTEGWPICHASNSDGYEFEGWYYNNEKVSTSDNYNTHEEDNVTLKGNWDRTYYAKFTPISYTVTFDKNAEDATLATTSSLVTYDAIYGEGTGGWPIPTRPGYTFDGWFTASSGGTEVTSTTTVAITADQVLYAHWTANTYTVAFSGNGSTKGSVASVGATYDQNVTLAANAYRKHQYIVTYDSDGGSSVGPDSTLYAFQGWNTQNDGNGTNYAAGATLTTPNFTPTQGATYTLYAKWSATTSSISLPTPTKSGWNFEGWYDGGTKVSSPYTPTDDVELTANWVEMYNFTVTGANRTLDVDEEKSPAFTFVHSDDPTNLTVNIEDDEVISYDASTNTLKGLAVGTSTISFTQVSPTATVNAGRSGEWTITVKRVTNTLSISATSDTKYVDEEITDFVSTNSNATVQSSSSDATVAYYDAENNKIVIPNSEAKSFASKVVNIKIWQEQNDKYTKGDTCRLTLTVQKYATSFSGSPYNLMVDAEQTADYSYTNTSAAQPTASSSNDFFYTIDDISYTNSSKNKKYNSLDSLVRFDPSTKKITALNAGTGKITLRQKETYKYTGDTVSFNVAVYKYDNSMEASNYAKKVDETQESDYVWTYTKPDEDYIGEAHTAGTPTNNNEDAFYYTIENIEYDSLELNKKYNSLDSLVRFVPSTKIITALNAGSCEVTFHQQETYKYNAGSDYFIVAVSKYDNTLYANGSTSYSVATYVDRTLDSILLTATNTDYANCPISVTQTRATNDTVSYGYNESTHKVGIRTHHDLTTAAWSFHQNENYKYVEADGSFSVTVGAVAEATDCYVLSNQSKTESEWHGNTCHEHTWDDENAAGVVRFEIRKDSGLDQGYKVQQKIGNNWIDVTDYKNDHSTSWGDWKTQTLDRTAKGVRFMLKGGSLNYVRNVSVTRATYLEASNVTINKTSSDNPVYPNDVAGAGRLIVDHSLANGGALKIANNNPSRFTLAKSTISDVDCKTAKDTIAISYTPIAEGHDTATLIIYNDVYRDTVIVAGVCVKRNQHGEWKENISTLEIGTKVGNPYSSTRSLENEVTYRSSNTDYLEVNLIGDTIFAKAKGSARLYVTVAGDDDYYALEDSIDITVTDKKVQYIVWGDGMAKTLRRLHVGDSRVLLDAKAMSNIDTCSTNGKRPITFVSRNTSIANVETEDGKSYLTITSVKANAGETWIVASQAGGDDGYHDYIPVSDSLRVIVRDPDAICPVKYLYNFNDSTHLVDNKEDGIRTDPVNDGYVGTIVMERGNGSKTKTRLTCTFEAAHNYAIWYAKSDRNDAAGSITIEQYIPGRNWVTAKTVTSFVNGTWTRDSIALNPNATQVRGVMTQSSKYIYFGGLQVKMIPYVDVDEGGTQRDTLVFSSFIGTPQVKDLKLRWYARRDIHLILPEGAPFTLSEDAFDRVCENDTTDLRITFNTMVGQTDSCYYLVFSDGVENGFRDTVVLKATVTAEEITFTGGDWSKTPNKYKVANVAAGESLTISTEIAMYSLSIATGASVTVTANGGLSVGAGGIANSSINKIKLESNTDGKTGYIRVSPEYKGVMPEADVELFTKAYYNKAVAHSAKMQYIGVPVDKENYAAKDIFKTKSYVYSWSESKGQWVNNKNSLKVKPFTGYSITQYDESDGKVVEFSGSLLAPKDTTIELAYSGVGSGLNFLANSYAAPIDISQFSYSDFSLEDEDDKSVDFAIYLFNTGSKGEYEGGDPEDVTAAGQYITVSPGSAMRLRGLDDNYPIVIPSMQGFFVRTTEAGKSLKLDYNKLIWNADYSKRGNEKLRVQGRASEENTEETEEELGGAMKISLYSDIAVDHMYLLESDDYSKGYENGYDGRKMMAGELNVYAVEGEETLAVDATNDLEGTIIGVRTGSSDAYTLAFSRVQNVENLFLLDSENGQTMRIEEGATYTFYAAPDCDIDSRFEIIGLGGQGVFTNIGNDKNETKAVKYIKDNTMYILKNGVKYTSLGQKVE